MHGLLPAVLWKMDFRGIKVLYKPQTQKPYLMTLLKFRSKVRTTRSRSWNPPIRAGWTSGFSRMGIFRSLWATSPSGVDLSLRFHFQGASPHLRSTLYRQPEEPESMHKCARHSGVQTTCRQLYRNTISRYPVLFHCSQT